MSPPLVDRTPFQSVRVHDLELMRQLSFLLTTNIHVAPLPASVCGVASFLFIPLFIPLFLPAFLLVLLPQDAADSVLHVTDVHKGSPAEAAGLVAQDDYILGTTDSVFRDQEDLLAALTSHLEIALDMFVYNAKTDVVRHCVVVPSQKWGGAGTLGCELGHGYLHRLPADSTTTPGRVQPVGAVPGSGGGGGGGGGGDADGGRRVATPYGIGTFVRDVVAGEKEAEKEKEQPPTAAGAAGGAAGADTEAGAGAGAGAGADSAPEAAGAASAAEGGSNAATEGGNGDGETKGSSGNGSEPAAGAGGGGGETKAAAAAPPATDPSSGEPMCIVKLDWKLAGDASALVTLPVSQVTDIKPPPVEPQAPGAVAASGAAASTAPGASATAAPPVVAAPRPDAAHPAGQAVLATPAPHQQHQQHRQHQQHQDQDNSGQAQPQDSDTSNPAPAAAAAPVVTTSAAGDAAPPAAVPAQAPAPPPAAPAPAASGVGGGSGGGAAAGAVVAGDLLFGGPAGVAAEGTAQSEAAAVFTQ